MDEKLDYYSSEEMLRRASSQLIITHTSTTDLLELEPSKKILPYKNYHLHLMENKEILPERITLPSTKMDRLAFYRQYMTSILKSQILSRQTDNVNLLFWNNVFNVIFKSLSHIYINMFLASYTPEQHIFVSKMVPLLCGFKFATIITSFAEIHTFVHNLVILFAYTIDGFTWQNPWNRCFSNPSQKNSSVICCEPIDFAARISNVSWNFTRTYYITEKGEKFQLVQMLYFRWFILNLSPLKQMICLTLIMIPALLSYKFVTKRNFWKMFNILQCLVIAMDLMALLYIMLVDWEDYSTQKYYPYISPVMRDRMKRLESADLDLMSESITSPPVVHVLTAKSAQEINPSMDSAAIILSYLLMYVLKAFLNNKLRQFCENMFRTPVNYTYLNPYSWFYFWPIFLSTFYFGNILTLLYFTINSIVDFMTVAVTYYCFLEMIVVEWKRVKSWMVALGMVVCFLVPYFAVIIQRRVAYLMYVKGIITLAEIVFICVFYPVGRLVDDITFHTGNTPPSLRILTLRIMPVYYCVKLYRLYSGLTPVLLTQGRTYIRMKDVTWFVASMVVPIVLGMIFIIYKYIIRDKRGCQRLFAPVCDWGPQDQEKKHLRKLYDSRYYIGSQAIRSLSRYMFEKSGSNVFHLDLNYDPERRSTSMYRIENEIKED